MTYPIGRGARDRDDPTKPHQFQLRNAEAKSESQLSSAALVTEAI
ncbi:hypothetical protein AB395_0000864 [Sinorhizobium fredii CCBAU 45436]|nr:hypothetical protein AB395_0000864 [Sinorhizobium fredii CCBAU 45436]